MNVLLIGGTGVLSSAVTKEALLQGINITMINRGLHTQSLLGNVELIKTDRKNYDYIKRMLQGRTFDAVIDFLCLSDKDTVDSFNLYKNFTKQYFFISSCAVYDTRTGEICSENSPKVLPIWEYSVKKWKSELQLMQLAKNANVHYTVIRPCVTYGDTRIPYGISPQYGYHWTLAARILSGKPIIRWNGGINRCNMTHVDDFAVGVVGLIGNPKAYDEAFNICGEECPTFNDVLDTIAKYLDKRIVLFDITSEEYAEEVPSRAGEILGGRSIDAINSNEKIKSVVPAFKQTISLRDGICKTLDAYKSQNYQRGIDWAFDADTDRIIKKYAKKKGIDAKGYNLRFVNYLGTASKTDQLTYWLEFHKDNKSIFLFKKFVLYYSRIIKKIRKL